MTHRPGLDALRDRSRRQLIMASASATGMLVLTGCAGMRRPEETPGPRLVGQTRPLPPPAIPAPGAGAPVAPTTSAAPGAASSPAAPVGRASAAVRLADDTLELLDIDGQPADGALVPSTVGGRTWMMRPGTRVVTLRPAGAAAQIGNSGATEPRRAWLTLRAGEAVDIAWYLAVLEAAEGPPLRWLTWKAASQHRPIGSVSAERPAFRHLPFEDERSSQTVKFPPPGPGAAGDLARIRIDRDLDLTMVGGITPRDHARRVGKGDDRVAFLRPGTHAIRLVNRQAGLDNNDGDAAFRITVEPGAVYTVSYYRHTPPGARTPRSYWSAQATPGIADERSVWTALPPARASER